MMKNLLRTELCKAFRNGYFLASLALGILFVALSAWYEISLYYSDIGFLQQVRTVEEMGYVKYPLVPMSILYNSWIGGECVSVGYTLFFTLLPLLAVLPYGRSFSQEQKNGYLKVIIPRCGRTRYFASKWVATFLSGGVAVVLPLLVSLGICALVLILSRLVDTFISRISLTMLPVPKPHNTACVLSWEEARRWQSRSSGYSSS